MNGCYPRIPQIRSMREREGVTVMAVTKKKTTTKKKAATKVAAKKKTVAKKTAAKVTKKAATKKAAAQPAKKFVGFSTNEKYAPQEARVSLVKDNSFFEKLSENEKNALQSFAEFYLKNYGNADLQSAELKKLAESNSISVQQFFKAAYLVLLNKERGPKLAPFLLALGEKAARALEKV